MKKLLQRVSGGGAFNRTMTGLANILGFMKKKEVSEKVIASEKNFSHFIFHYKPLTLTLSLKGRGDNVDFLCENTETVFSPLTSHFSQKNPPQPSLGKGGGDGLQSAPLESEGNNLSSKASEKNLSPFTKPSRGRNGLSQDKALQTRLVRGAVDSSQRAAFTLAEVLITLGIIGVVAAITMPTLIANHQKKTFATRLKQTYSQLSQAIQLAQAEYGDSTSWTGLEYSSTTSANIANKYFLPYLKVVNPLKSSQLKDFGYNDGFLTKNPQVKYAEPNWTYNGTNLANGVNLFFGFDGVDVKDRLLIFVDVNGSAGPNVTGRDLFMFRFSPSKARLTPYGDEFTRTQLKQFCSSAPQPKNFFNLVCTALVMKDGWVFADDYPW